MAPVFGIFVLAELHGAAAAHVHAVQKRYDPKLAKTNKPHVTIAGSSGIGALPPDTPVALIHERLAPIAESSAALTLHFGAPIRFMQTDIISLPLDPHGPLRELHERIAKTGLPFARARFYFSPHCTLNYYASLTPQRERELLAIRVPEPVLITALQVYLTNDPQPSRKLLELELAGASAPRGGAHSSGGARVGH